MPTQKRKMIFDFRDPFAMIFPVLLYVVFENMFGLTIAMAVAFPLSIILFVYKYFDVNFHRLDWFMFPSILFMLLAFSFSKWLENTSFHPITSEIAICFVFLVAILFYRRVSAWIMRTKRNKGLLGLKANLNAMFVLNVSSFFVFLIHIINYLIVYYRNPMKITGNVDFYEYLEIILFFILGVLAYLRMTWIKSYFKKEIFLPILTKDERVCGYETKKFVYSFPKRTEEKFIHPGIRVLLIYQNKLLLRNYAEAGSESSLWDLSVTSYLLYGETYEEGISRMFMAMYGSDKCKAKFVLKYDYESEYDIQRVFLHCMYVETPFIAEEKKSNLKLWTSGQLIENLNQNIFSEKMEKEIVLLRDLSFPGLFDRVPDAKKES